LAAAYAELGDFTNAQMWQQKSIDLIDGEVHQLARDRLDNYKQHKPLRTKPQDKLL
jgi:hypothetical protein